MSDEEQRETSRKRREREPRPDMCRRYARKRLAAGLPAILDCFIEQASGGSIPHMKLLMTLSSVDKEGPARATTRRRRRKAPSLSELLLAELREGPAKPEESDFR